MPEYLFVYGTLRPACAPSALQPLLAKWRPSGAGSVVGTLYDLGEYPGAVLLPTGESRVFGEVFELADAAAAFLALDEYEGFIAEQPAASLFLRTRCEVTLADDRRLSAWIYVYNQSLATATQIPSGDYLRNCVKQNPSNRRNG